MHFYCSDNTALVFGASSGSGAAPAIDNAAIAAAANQLPQLACIYVIDPRWSKPNRFNCEVVAAGLMSTTALIAAPSTR